jgi:hypothetical protein
MRSHLPHASIPVLVVVCAAATVAIRGQAVPAPAMATSLGEFDPMDGHVYQPVVKVDNSEALWTSLVRVGLERISIPLKGAR